MQAEFANVVNSKRHNLAEVLPLETPYSLFIDVCNACNFKCRFCAIQYSGRSLPFQKMCMEYDLFEKIIQDLKRFPDKLKMLRLAGNGEPLMNKQLPEMIRLAAKEKVAEHIEIVSNASLLNQDLNRRLVDAGLNRIRISIEGVDAAQYYAMSGVKLDWNQFVDNITDLYEHKGNLEIYIKTVDSAVPDETSKQQFLDTFGNICDKIFIEHVIPVWADYDEIKDDFAIEHAEGLHGHAIKDVEVCPFPFYSCIIHPDGEVDVCCSDWERKISMGSAKTKSIYDIWNGEKYRNFLLEMLGGGRKKITGCQKCDYPSYDAVDDLDSYRDKALENMSRHKNE